ncbi:hypothetical protein D3C78_1949520 [compost metagenome]
MRPSSDWISCSACSPEEWGVDSLLDADGVAASSAAASFLRSRPLAALTTWGVASMTSPQGTSFSAVIQLIGMA